MRLIDADKLKRHYAWWNNEEQRLFDQIVDAQPTVTVVHGEWIPVSNGRGGNECNMCHAYAPSYQSGTEYNSPYCPNCGAKMDGERKDGAE